MKQYNLLPFEAQLAGWILLPLSFILYFILSFYSLDFLPKNLDYFTIRVFQHVSLFLICFSREKREDEYLSFLRGRSLFIMAVVYGLIMILVGSIYSAFTYGVIPLSNACRFKCLGFMPDPRIMMVIYIIIYKSYLCISTLKSRNNEE